MLRRKSVGSFSAILLGLAFSSSAFAGAHGMKGDDSKGAMKSDTKIWGELRAGFTYDDAGFKKTEGVDPAGQTVMKVYRGKLGFSGSEGKVKYKMVYNAASSSVENAMATMWFTKMIGLRVGQDKVQQNGYDIYKCGLYCIERAYHKGPFSTYQPGASLHLKVAGEVMLQVTNDVQAPKDTDGDGETDVPGNGSWNNDSEQPAFILAYWGNFAKGKFKPLVQVGSYDNNHSMYYDVALAFDIMNIKGHVDYYSDTRNAKALDGTEFKDLATTETSITAQIGYKVGKKLYPYFYYTGYTKSEDVFSGEARDDGTKSTMGAAVQYSLAKSYTPYFGVYSKSANGYKDADGEDETRTQMVVHAGIMSKMHF